MKQPLFVLQWSGVITLCLCHLTTGSMIALERQHSNIGLVGGPYESRNANGTGDSQQRSQSSILEAVGHGNTQVYLFILLRCTIIFDKIVGDLCLSNFTVLSYEY